MAELGFRTVQEMIGRSDRLDLTDAVRHWKTQVSTCESSLPAQGEAGVAVYNCETQNNS